ncbi:MAG TPA: DUF4062 domain-containing protein, partial [Vicinamibacteria bacterium]
MRVYVSSTFEDLKEHRVLVVQILRQLGHDVVAMEDYVSESAVPLTKVLEDVGECDALIEIVAWRYGYTPKKGPAVPGATPGKTSISEYEYRKAVASSRPVLAFLVDERTPWPAHFIDGLHDATGAAGVRAFRAELQRERLVAYFTTPDSLASRVSAAVGALGMRKEVRRQIITPISATHLNAFTAPTYLSDSHTMPIVDMVGQREPPLAACISLATEWWSTRLYLLAAVGQALGNLSRIVFLDDERFIGMASATSVRNALRRIHPQAEQFERTVLSVGPGSDVRDTARGWLERDWNKILRAKPGDSAPERRVKLSVTPQNLRLWLGEAFLETPVRVEGIETTTAIDLLRILDYPNDFVPVVA